jgi:uncharacterized sulfatase
LCEYDGSIAELHDLSQDPSEARNVAADHSDLVRRMTNAVLAWHESMPPDNGATYVPNSGGPRFRPAMSTKCDDQKPE